MAYITNPNKSGACFFDFIDDQGAVYDGKGLFFGTDPEDPTERERAWARKENVAFDLRSGMRIRVSRLPSVIRLEESGKRLLDFHFHTFSDAARELAERFEPGKHQFFRVPVQSPSGRPLGFTNFYNLCARLNAVDKARSVLKPINLGEREVFHPPSWPEQVLVLKKSVISGHHLWRDFRIADGYFVSDKIAESES